jgi:hypothetical protein
MATSPFHAKVYNPELKCWKDFTYLFPANLTKEEREERFLTRFENDAPPMCHNCPSPVVDVWRMNQHYVFHCASDHCILKAADLCPESTPPPSTTPPPPSTPPPKVMIILTCHLEFCGHIQTPPYKTCSRCKDVVYCNAVCQRADWASHRPHCVKQ